MWLYSWNKKKIANKIIVDLKNISVVFLLELNSETYIRNQIMDILLQD